MEKDGSRKSFMEGMVMEEKKRKEKRGNESCNCQGPLKKDLHKWLIYHNHIVE